MFPFSLVRCSARPSFQTPNLTFVTFLVNSNKLVFYINIDKTTGNYEITHSDVEVKSKHIRLMLIYKSVRSLRRKDIKYVVDDYFGFLK